jgi:CRISPR-associated endonuclease/helicase Cas3
MTLYPYQEKVKELLHSGRSVILQAPTGSGKTRAALAPFIEAFFDFPPAAFPKQCLYAVPMRVLATQFEREYHHLAESYERRFRRRLDVRIQTGERPEDPQLMGDLVFATLDQILSSALGVPYSLSPGKANVNIGAVLGSYLVFDEFHLFPPQAAVTTLQLMRLFSRFAPFVFMTATFSKVMLQEIAHLLDAEAILVSVEEVMDIGTCEGTLHPKERRYFFIESTLDAGDVLAVHDRRSLCVCNTVDRALGLYQDLIDCGCRPVPVTHPALAPLYDRLMRAQSADEHSELLDRAVNVLQELMADAPAATDWVMLLHSRFERAHRQVKEAFLQMECGPRRENWQVPRLLVVATQVVEVGLDITSQALHTELAPAASVVQRAGRCARYPGELGEVYVYQVPEQSDGKPSYAPYASSVSEIVVCERTLDALRERNGQVLKFPDEQAVVDHAHKEADRTTLETMREDEGRIWDMIHDGLVLGDPSIRPRLIREISSRTIIAYDAPDDLTMENPFRYEGFSLWHGSLRGALRGLIACAKDMGLDWALRYPVVRSENGDARDPVAYQWQDVTNADDISSSLLFAVHPKLVSYDAAQGFRLGVPGEGQYRSPISQRRAGSHEYYAYTVESYSRHVRALLQVYERRFRQRLAWLIGRLEAQQGEHCLLERAVRLVLALHDVGKLQVEWQQWAANYQERVAGTKPPFLMAHTQSETEEHRRIARAIRPSRPKHAGEGACASARILWEALDGRNHRDLYLAAVTAIACHHSPWLREAGSFRLHPDARQVLVDAMMAVGATEAEEWVQWLITEQEAPDLGKRLLPPPPPWQGWLFYFILARILRLCDGMSQELE